MSNIWPEVWSKEPDLALLNYAYELFATDPAKGLAELRKLADRGSAMSMMYIASAYRNGKGVISDSLQAEEWYKRAAAYGIAPASYELGRSLLERREYLAAIESFLKGDSVDYSPSLNMLGIIYRDGTGVLNNNDKAEEYFFRAAQLGHIFARRGLGGIFLRKKNILKKFKGILLIVSSVPKLIYKLLSDPNSDSIR